MFHHDGVLPLRCRLAIVRLRDFLRPAIQMVIALAQKVSQPNKILTDLTQQLTKHPSLEMHNRANTLALMHQVERGVDVFQWHRMRNEFVDLNAAVHILIDHAGKL